MEISQRSPWLCKPFVAFVLALPMAYYPIDASAACSDSKVKRLSRQGKTVATIARTCNMDVDEVRDLLEEDDDEAETTPSRRSRPKQSTEPQQSPELAPGAPLAPCGCWGPVAPGYRQPSQACRSGYAIPRMCQQVCPAGGYAWQGVCG